MMEAYGNISGLIHAIEGDGEVSGKAMESLRRIGRSAENPLILMCDGNDLDRQLKASIILGEIKSKKAVPALIRLAYSPNVDVRACACVSMGLIDDDRAISTLVYRLYDGNKDVREAAAFSLSCMGDRIIDPVVTCFARLNQQLLNSIDDLETAKGVGNFDPTLMARNVLCRNQMELIRDGILTMISCSDRSWFDRFLHSIFSNEQARDTDLSLVAGYGSAACGPLVDLMDCGNDDIRLRAVQALGIIGDREAVESMERLLDDDNREVREATANVLRNMTETRLVDVSKESGPGKGRVIVTFECEYCGVPVEYGKAYCPACGALLMDTNRLV